MGPWIPAKVAEALVDVDRDSLITTDRINYTGFVPDSPERNSRRKATERAWLPTSGSPSQELQLVWPVITFPHLCHRFSTNWRDAELLFLRVAVGTTRGSPGSRSIAPAGAVSPSEWVHGDSTRTHLRLERRTAVCGVVFDSPVEKRNAGFLGARWCHTQSRIDVPALLRVRAVHHGHCARGRLVFCWLRRRAGRSPSYLVSVSQRPAVLSPSV